MSGRSDTVPAHGGLLERELAELGVEAAEIVDFSVNVNHYGPSPVVLGALRAAPVSSYPDPTGHRARCVLGEALAVASDRIVLGNGAADLLWTLARRVPAGATVLVVEPTFSELRRALGQTGVRVVEWRARREDGFAIDLAAVAERARAEGASWLYLCNPNNPTGVALPAAEVDAFARANPRLTIVLDQAFLTLSERSDDLSYPLADNVVAVRSLTKDHALAGIRVAYLIASRELAAGVEVSRPPWTTSAPAQAAAIAAVSLSGFVDDCRRRLFADRDRLRSALGRLGLLPLSTATTFCLVPVADGAALRRRLLARHRVLVRDCGTFGLPGFIRLGARPAPDVARLVGALAVELCAQLAAEGA